MDALQQVFTTILGVFDIIRKFFEELFGGIKKEEETTAPAEEA